MTGFPVAAPGLRLRVAPNEFFYAEAAAFSGNVGDPGTNDKHRTRFSFREDDGALIFRGGLPVASGRGREVRLWADAPGGSYKLGGFHDSGRFEDGNGGRSNRGNQGFYAVAEQEVWRAGGETDRALAVFGRVGFAPDYRNLVPLYFDTGFNFRGAVPGRVDDTLGLGFSYAQLSDQLVAGGGHEQVLELTYRLTLGDHIFLQPDLQFIIHPGATDSAATAMVAGLRLNLSY